MAIGCVHTEWLFHLYFKGAFDNKNSLLDLGPQDIQISEKWLVEYLRYKHNDNINFKKIFLNEYPLKNCQFDFYRMFGINKYHSADIDDDRATIKIDLNNVTLDVETKFDVITNFGTAEHVFNIGNVFKTMHECLKPGGLSLHAVPSFGFVNHGFYTPNPNLFIEIARVNNYKIIDFSYVDNMFVREFWHRNNYKSRFDFEKLEIKLRDMENTQLFMTKIVNLFLDNSASKVTKEILNDLNGRKYSFFNKDRPEHMCFLFDHVFVALEKPLFSSPFRVPIQRMEGVAPID